MRDDIRLGETRAENERLARELVEAKVRIEELSLDLNDAYEHREKLDQILRATANALKGEPDQRMLHSWHDLPDWATRARAVAVAYLAATAGGEAERRAFVQAIEAWRDLIGRDLFETAAAFVELDAQAGKDAAR